VHEQWELSITKLSKWMKEQGTDPVIQHAIIGHLLQWASDIPSTEQTTKPFVEEQQKIGWDRMLDRWLTRSWRDHQEKMWKTGKS